jgi:hypothetical protein
VAGGLFWGRWPTSGFIPTTLAARLPGSGLLDRPLARSLSRRTSTAPRRPQLLLRSLTRHTCRNPSCAALRRPPPLHENLRNTPQAHPATLASLSRLLCGPPLLLHYESTTAAAVGCCCCCCYQLLRVDAAGASHLLPGCADKRSLFRCKSLPPLFALCPHHGRY